MKLVIQSILVIMLFFVGVATAAPTEVDERIKYATSLNSIASSMMNWYGSLITTKEHISFEPSSADWDKYRTRYPDNITQIQITNTELEKLDVADSYQFKVQLVISYKNSDGEQTQSLDETFLFQVSLFSKAVIKNISRDKEESAKTAHSSRFNRQYYKAREFSYAWLAYLDGVTSMKPTMYGEQWLDKANYSMKIGGEEVTGSVASTLAKRKQYLTKGGHLLRSLELKELADKPNSFILDLIMEWKGVNTRGKPVLAKIHQQIEYQVQQDNSWQVISIKEQHLLPDIAPWAGLLC